MLPPMVALWRIWGEATREEVKELSEDGIDCLPLPPLPEDKN